MNEFMTNPEPAKENEGDYCKHYQTISDGRVFKCCHCGKELFAKTVHDSELEQLRRENEGLRTELACQEMRHLSDWDYKCKYIDKRVAAADKMAEALKFAESQFNGANVLRDKIEEVAICISKIQSALKAWKELE